jgi:hypothetical protein
MSCPNSDPQFDKMLSRYLDINSPDYPLYRARIFYLVCIWVRLVLYTLVYVYREKEWMPYVTAAFSLFSIVNLKGSIQNPGRQWWSKRFQLAIAILVLVASIDRKSTRLNSSHSVNEW